MDLKEMFKKKEDKGVSELMKEIETKNDRIINTEKDDRVTDLIIRIEDIIRQDEAAMELFERITKGIETVYEVYDGKRVLDVSLLYNNYKWGARDNYSKRFKNEESEVKDNETEQIS